jgi:hypothetical protein
MPHQNPHSMNAGAQNAATDPAAPQDKPTGQDRETEPRSYAARDASDATLAPPAAGEIAEYADEGDPSLGAHQGRNHTNRELHAHDQHQGAKTRKATKDIISRRGG